MRQASPLTLEQVKHLEHTVRNHRHSYMIGMQRDASDPRFLDEIGFGGPGFIEIKTRHHKTAALNNKKSRRLPIAVPVFEITSEGWISEWLKSAAMLSINFDTRQFGPLLAAPIANCEVSHLAVTTAEAADLLKGYLRPIPAANQILGSHSLKVTTLSWCAKAGLSEEHRLVLGRQQCDQNDSGNLLA